ncbi:uncharacterized protein [Engystomops pustulosus]|uniref:uncharacterized protein n=1 Tax=Engystomops pustulosus TaxID=76066 RepID=UPI003AFB27BE
MQSTERSTRSSKRIVPEPAHDHELPAAHTSSGQYMCIECSETFNNKLELNSHRQSHVTKRQFTCSHCGRGFHHQFFLQMHERSHEDGIPNTSLAKSSTGRVMSTRSSKSSQVADIIHVAPAPSKSTYHLNSRVEFKRELSTNQDLLPRECVTRRTQGTSPAETADDSEKTQFELRISKLSDRTIHLIDPYGNTLEILAEVFNTYTIGEPDDDDDDDDDEEEASMSPIGDLRVSASPPSSPAPLSMETTQDLEICSSPQVEVSEPSEPKTAGGVAEDVPPQCMESVSSISPKTLPDASDDSENVPSTQAPAQSDTQELLSNVLTTEIPSISSITGENLTVTEGPLVGDADGCDKEPAVVTAQTEDPAIKLGDPVTSLDSDVSHGGNVSTEDRPTLDKPVTPEPLIDNEEKQSTQSPLATLTDALDPSLPVTPLISEADFLLDINESNDDLVTSCMKDIQDLPSDQEIPPKIDVWASEFDEGNEPCGAEIPLISQDESPAVTLLEVDSTELQTTSTLHEDVPEDAALGTNQFTGNKDCSSSGDIEEINLKDRTEAASNSERDPSLSKEDLSRGVLDDAPQPADVCASQPSPQNIENLMMSVDIPDQGSPLDNEERSDEKDLETVHISLETEVNQPVVVPDTLPLTGSDPIPQEEQSPPESSEGPIHPEKTDLVLHDRSQNDDDDGSQLNPDHDPGVSSSLPDMQPLSSSDLELDLNLRDDKLIGSDVSFSNMGFIGSSKTEESQVPGDAPVVTPAELAAYTIEDSSHENLQTSVYVTEVDDVEKIPFDQKIPSGGDNPTGLPEPEEVGVTDGLMSPCHEDLSLKDFTEGDDVLFGALTAAGVGASECDLSQQAQPTEQDIVTSTTSGEISSGRSLENADLKDVFENLRADPPALCLLDETLELSPDLKILSEKCLLSSDDVKDLVENDTDKSLSHEVPPKQYIQMSNADLTENDIADDLESGTLLLDAPNVDETPKDDDISAVSGDDESYELSDMLSPDIQDNEYAEDLDDKHVGVGSQCVKCGRRVRRGRKELVWFPDCYKCRLKTKREERRSGEGNCHSPEFVLETDRKKVSPDSSRFQIKQEVDSVRDNASYRTVKSAHTINEGSPALYKKTYKCPKCEKSFRLPTLLASHMKCHTLPQCLGCGCPLALKNKGKRIPKRCHECFQKFKEQRKEEMAPGAEGEDESLDSESGSLYVEEADDEPEDYPDNPKPGSIKRGTKPFHSALMRKHKKMNPAIQALYCTCDDLYKTGAKPPKICKNCQKPVRDRLVRDKVTQLKTKKRPPPDNRDLLGESSLSCDTELSHDEDFSKEDELFTGLGTSDQIIPVDGEKPRLCPQCGKIFKCNRSMNLHLMSHSATQCESCGCRLQKKKRVGRWSKKCRVCRLLTKDSGAIEEVLPSEKILKDKSMASLRLKMKQSKVVRNRKVHSIVKSKKDLKWMNMILAVKGLTRKPRKKKEQSIKSPSEVTADDGSATCVGPGAEDLGSPSGLPVSKKKVLDGTTKTNRKCLYKEKNIIKVEEQQLPPYIDDPSTASVLVKEEEENQCLECNEMFMNFELLLSHQQDHVKEEAFTCAQCPQSFSTAQYLSIHTSAHAEGPPFRCLECNKTFTRRNHLGVHRRVHTGARPYACPDCPCRFRQKGSLIIHRYTHRNLQFMLLKPFQCSVCNKSFKQKERLVIHERLHTGECPFSCKDCDKVFPSKSRLYVHRRSHKVTESSSSVEQNTSSKEESGGPPFQCKDCNKICSTKASLVLHCKVHKSPATSKQSGSYEENQETRTDEAALTSEHHLNIKTEPDVHPFTCKDCNKVCSTKASLVLHRKVHGVGQISAVGSPAFICKDCHKVCSTKASLVLHRKVHKSPVMCHLKTDIGDPPYTCQDCNKVCSTKASFVLHSKVHRSSSSSEHILKTNMGPKSFVCKKCNFVCSTKASFVLHRRVHRSSQSLVKKLKAGTGEHPFTCKHCNKVCSTKASLVLHCKVHKSLPGTSEQSSILQAEVEEKPYHCKECGKLYSTKGRLLSHIKLHAPQDGSSSGEQLVMDTEEKPFACPICHMRFTRLKILVRHKLLHGEDVFSCGHCGKRFLFQKSLMNHVPVCLKKSKGKGLQGKEKVPKKRKIKDGSSSEESAPKKRKNENKKAATAVQKLKQKKLLKAKKLVINKEKGKAKSSQEKKPKKAKGEDEQQPEAEGGEPSDGKPERLLEAESKEKDKKPKDVGKVKKVVKKVPLKPKRQKVTSESLKKWRIIAAATVKKRKLQAVMSAGKKKGTVKKKGPAKAKTGGKSSKE